MSITSPITSLNDVALFQYTVDNDHVMNYKHYNMRNRYMAIDDNNALLMFLNKARHFFFGFCVETCDLEGGDA